MVEFLFSALTIDGIVMAITEFWYFRSWKYFYWWRKDLCLAFLYIFLIAESKYDLSHLSSDKKLYSATPQWDETPPDNPPVPLVCNLDREGGYPESQERSCYTKLAPTFLLWLRRVHNHQVEIIYFFSRKKCVFISIWRLKYSPTQATEYVRPLVCPLLCQIISAVCIAALETPTTHKPLKTTLNLSGLIFNQNLSV